MTPFYWSRVAWLICFGLVDFLSFFGVWVWVCLSFGRWLERF